MRIKIYVSLPHSKNEHCVAATVYQFRLWDTNSVEHFAATNKEGFSIHKYVMERGLGHKAEKDGYGVVKKIKKWVWKEWITFSGF